MENTKIIKEMYKYHTKDKKTYLSRKKHINRHLKYLKKKYRDSEKNKKIIYLECIKFREKDLKKLNEMYVYYKNKNK